MRCSRPDESSLTRTGEDQVSPRSSDRATRMFQSSPSPSGHAKKRRPWASTTSEGRGKAQGLLGSPVAEPGWGFTRTGSVHDAPRSQDVAAWMSPVPNSHQATATLPSGHAAMTGEAPSAVGDTAEVGDQV